MQCSWREDLKAPFKLNQHLIPDFGLKRHLSLLKTKERKSDIKIKISKNPGEEKEKKIENIIFSLTQYLFYLLIFFGPNFFLDPDFFYWPTEEKY